jgi:hypothetical protein
MREQIQRNFVKESLWLSKVLAVPTKRELVSAKI